jgi:hypothetical protein
MTQALYAHMNSKKKGKKKKVYVRESLDFLEKMSHTNMNVKNIYGKILEKTIGEEFWIQS